MSFPILLVDDEPTIAIVVEEVLKRAKMDISFQSVPSGYACLKALRNGFQGLILMDVMMPGMTGWETIAKLRDEGLLNDVAISMLTAVHDPYDKSEELAECIVNYIRKPFMPEDLIDAIADGMMMCNYNIEA